MTAVGSLKLDLYRIDQGWWVLDLKIDMLMYIREKMVIQVCVAQDAAWK